MKGTNPILCAKISSNKAESFFEKVISSTANTGTYEIINLLNVFAITWLISLITNPDKMLKMSLRNLEKAKEYSFRELNKRRVKFYEKLVEATTEYYSNPKGIIH